MNEANPIQLTNAQLVAALPEERASLVEAYLCASIEALHPDETIAVDPSSTLADLSIDSLQIVELKFGLDQLLGKEVDIELVITNPSLRQLAVNSVRDAGL